MDRRSRKTLAPLGDLLARGGLRGADGRARLRPTSRQGRFVGQEWSRPPPSRRSWTSRRSSGLRQPRSPSARPWSSWVSSSATRRRSVLAEAWRIAAPQVPDATLHLIGRGTLHDVVQRLITDLPEQTRWTESLPAEGVVSAMDDLTVLVLPSRSEGLPRVIIEAACRRRAVVATASGGIPDLVTHGENGLLVPSEDVAALADALVRVLSDRQLAERLGAVANAAAEPWMATPEEYARRVRALVERASSATSPVRRGRLAAMGLRRGPHALGSSIPSPKLPRPHP